MDPVAGPPDLLIVARNRPLLFETFSRMRSGDSDIEIVVDRRQPRPAGQREPDRRERNVTDALRTTGWAMIPSAFRTQARASPAASRGSQRAATSAGRRYFVTLDTTDVECLRHVLDRHSEAYRSLGEALDVGDGTMSVRCDSRAVGELLFAARWNCPNAVEAIRSAIAASAEG